MLLPVSSIVIMFEMGLVLVVPRILYYLGHMAIGGLVHDKTLTHFGVKSGLLAQLYGAGYGACFLMGLLMWFRGVDRLADYGWSEVLAALKVSLQSGELGMLLVGMGLFILAAVEAAIWITARTSKLPRRTAEAGRKIGRLIGAWTVGAFFAWGLAAWLGLPHWANLAGLILWVYLSPFTSPEKMMQLMAGVPLQRQQSGQA
jgi:hypothetical protein